MVRLPVKREQQRQEVMKAMMLVCWLVLSGEVYEIFICLVPPPLLSVTAISLSTLTTHFELTNFVEKIWKFDFLLSPVCLQYEVAKTNIALKKINR